MIILCQSWCHYSSWGAGCQVIYFYYYRCESRDQTLINDCIKIAQAWKNTRGWEASEQKQKISVTWLQMLIFILIPVSYTSTFVFIKLINKFRRVLGKFTSKFQPSWFQMSFDKVVIVEFTAINKLMIWKACLIIRCNCLLFTFVLHYNMQ